MVKKLTDGDTVMGISYFPKLEDVPVLVLFDFAISNGNRSSDLTVFEPSMTRQEFAEECDINTIMAQYEKHGVISHMNPVEPMYLDLSDVPDLARGLEIMNDATAAFMSLPARIRREFDNDAIKFVEFASDGANLEKMREWGLAPPIPAPTEPVTVRVVADPAVDSSPSGDVPKPV